MPQSFFKKIFYYIIFSALIFNFACNQNLNQDKKKIKRQELQLSVDFNKEWELPKLKNDFPLIEQPQRNPFSRSSYKALAKDKAVNNNNLYTTKFVGVIKNDHQIWALLQQKDNSILHAKEGEYLEELSGEIQKILLNKIIIKKISIFNGKVHEELLTLVLNEKN